MITGAHFFPINNLSLTFCGGEGTVLLAILLLPQLMVKIFRVVEEETCKGNNT